MAANLLVMPSVGVLKLSDSLMVDDLDRSEMLIKPASLELLLERFRLLMADLGLDFADDCLRILLSSSSSHPAETKASSDLFPLPDFILTLICFLGVNGRW